MSRYLVRPFDDGSAQPGSDARYRENSLHEDFVQRPADPIFSRWWLLNGGHISVYVDDCRDFVLHIKKTIEEMLCNLKSNRKYVTPDDERDLTGMKSEINKWMNENSRVTSALESLQRVRFTGEERLQFETEIKLYPRANGGRLLIQKVYLDLTQLPVKVRAQTVVQLLNSLKTALENWLPCRSCV
jgi:hypothetical protein